MEMGAEDAGAQRDWVRYSVTVTYRPRASRRPQRAETVSLWSCLALARILLRTGQALSGVTDGHDGAISGVAMHVAITRPSSRLTIIAIIGERRCGTTLFTAAPLSSCQSCQQGV